MLAGELAAGAGAAYRGITQVDAHLIQRAALALTPERLSGLPEALPCFGVRQLLPCTGRGRVRREGQYLIGRQIHRTAGAATVRSPNGSTVMGASSVVVLAAPGT